MISKEFILEYIKLAVSDPEVELTLANFVDKYNEGKIKLDD